MLAFVTGLFGPSMWFGTGVGGVKLPAFALVRDTDNEWAISDDGKTKPQGFFVIDGDGDLAIDDTVHTGLTIARDTDGDFTVEVP